MYTMNCVFFDVRCLGLFFFGEKNCPLAFVESEAKLKSKILSLIQFDFSCVCRCAERSLPFFPLRILCRSLECWLLLMPLYKMIFFTKMYRSSHALIGSRLFIRKFFYLHSVRSWGFRWL